MLKYLHIENIAVIEKADIDFTGGFNVLTGETGAGKSIVIDAFNAILGQRTSKELIRDGCDRAVVSAEFCALGPGAQVLLTENGFAPDEEGNLVVSRTLSLSGSGSIRVNGMAATAAVLREIGRGLVNIHGQHDNQSLLDPQRHCGYIDRIAEDSALLEAYYAEFRKLNGIRRELAALETDEDEKQRRIDLLKYQINELEGAAVQVGEIDELKKRLSVAENYEKLMSALSDAYFQLNGGEESDGAVTAISQAQRLLASAGDTKFSQDALRLSEMLNQLDEICGDIRGFTEDETYASLDGDQLRERLDLLYRLQLKYGEGEETLLKALSDASAELSGIETSDARTAELSAALDESTERLVALGDRLTAARKKAAAAFSDQVTAVLKYLDMPDVAFAVDFTKGRYTKSGCDEVQFLISANAGENVRPLARIASGGELSRVMLAIKSVLAGRDDVDTLIFDEIDTGISGRAAGKVGQQLKTVSDGRQVVCVTHLAQIAAFADSHLLVEKHTENGRTYTRVFPLDEEQRIREIARIMSGTELTESLYQSAKELLDRSKNNGNL